MGHEQTSRRSTLDRATIGDELDVVAVNSPTDAPEWARWLEEIGFLAGERVRLMAKAIPGGDPLVVRVGQSTFALRRAAAACVEVAPTASSLRVKENHLAIEGGQA